MTQLLDPSKGSSIMIEPPESWFVCLVQIMLLPIIDPAHSLETSYLCCNNGPIQITVCHAPVVKNYHTQNQSGVSSLYPNLRTKLRKWSWFLITYRIKKCKFFCEAYKALVAGPLIPCQRAYLLISSESIYSSHTYLSFVLWTCVCFHSFAWKVFLPCSPGQLLIFLQVSSLGKLS